MNITKDPTYEVDQAQLSEMVNKVFQKIDDDGSMQRFWDTCHAVRCKFIRSIYQDLLTYVMGTYRADAFLKMPQVHLLSTKQWGQLLGGEGLGDVLDVGAGIGCVTKELAPLARSLCVTETSPYLASHLRSLGFSVFEGDITSSVSKLERSEYDTVFLCNVIDRCENPKSLLKVASKIVKNGGRLVIASPFPIRGYVRKHAYVVSQNESISQDSTLGWENAVDVFVSTINLEGTFQVERVSRMPYSIQTYTMRGYSTHDNGIVVFRKS